MVYLTSANWSLRHPVVAGGADLSASTMPTSAMFTEWVRKWSNEINRLLQSTTDNADTSKTIENIIDQLCFWEYLYDKASRMNDQIQVMNLGTPRVLPQMRAALSEMTPADSGMNVAWNFDMGNGERLDT